MFATEYFHIETVRDFKGCLHITVETFPLSLWLGRCEWGEVLSYTSACGTGGFSSLVGDI